MAGKASAPAPLLFGLGMQQTTAGHSAWALGCAFHLQTKLLIL